MARQLNVQRSSTGKVAQALQGLTSYLMTENDRLDAEQKEEQINLAAQTIAEGFQELGPSPSLDAITKQNFESISEAASLGALGENMPLISSLYQNTLNTRQIKRQEGEDAALKQFAAERFGITTPGVSGRDAIQLATTERQLERKFDVRSAEGITTSKVYGPLGEEKFSLVVDSLGLKEQQEFQQTQALFGHGLNKDMALFEHGLKKDLLSFENEFEVTAKFGQNVIEGFKFSEGLEGQNGEPIYTLKGGMGGPYTVNEKGQPIAYHKPTHRRKGIGGSTGDSLKQLDDLRKSLGQDVHKQAQVLLRSESGKTLISELTGLTEDEMTDKDGNLRFEFTTALENLISSGNFQEQLATVRTSLGEDVEGGTTVRGVQLLNQAQELAIGELKVASANFQNVKANILNQIPEGPYGGITNVKEWNAGSEFVMNLFNPSGPLTSQQKAGMLDYIGRLVPEHIQDPLGLQYEDFQNMDFKVQEEIIKFVYPYIQNR